MKQLIQKDKNKILQVYGADDNIVMQKAKGMYLYDAEGKAYLDFSAQFSACSIGHGNREMIDAITEQMGKLLSVTTMFVTEERIRLADQLLSLVPSSLEKVMFGCTGSDANELALKIAKVWRGGGRFFSFRRGFHGSTAASAAATGKSETIQENHGISELLPLGFLHSSPPYCYRCDFDKEPSTCDLWCLKYLEQSILHEGGDKVAGIILEPIFAAGGVIIPPQGFFEELRAICDRHGALLIYDEVVTGFGQTGKMFALEHSGVTPDILVTGKALTSGYIPGSAVMVRRDIGEKMDTMVLHGHTHSCYPGMCAAASKSIEIILRDNLVDNAAMVGSYLLNRLSGLKNKYAAVGDVRGEGLLLGIEIVETPEGKHADHNFAQRLYQRMLANGLVTELESRKNLENAVIVLHPPLICSMQDASVAADIIDEALLNVSSQES